MAIAVTAGQLLSLLPHAAVQGVIAVLFLGGSAYVWVSSFRAGQYHGADAAR
jgi:Ca2+/H+ antiporter, TMEM165/GDT1 family